MENDLKLIDWAVLKALGIAFDGNPEMYLVNNPMLLKNEALFLRAVASMGMDSKIVMDSELSTVANAGIPALVTTFLSPDVIEVLFAPMEMAKIVGEEQVGEWTTTSAMFPIIEPTGSVATYDDSSEDGTSDANASFPERDPYLYQTNTKWGDHEVAMAGAAKLNWINQKNQASIMSLQRFQNKSYAFGIAGLRNYGLLNDPNLSAPLVASVPWATATADQIYNDILINLFQKLVTQSKENVSINMASEITLCMSGTTEVHLLKINTYGISVIDMLKKAFKNLSVETAPEYATDAGELVQMMVKNVGDGTETVKGAFPMKLFAWPVEKSGSLSKQKKAQGTYGTVVKRPFLIRQLMVS